jgi:hypothetical protein
LIRFLSWRLAPKAAAAPKIGRGPGAAWVAGAPCTTSGRRFTGRVGSTPGTLISEGMIASAGSGVKLAANASPLEGGVMGGAEALWLGLGIRLWNGLAPRLALGIGLELGIWVGFWAGLWVGLDVWVGL